MLGSGCPARSMADGVGEWYRGLEFRVRAKNGIELGNIHFEGGRVQVAERTCRGCSPMASP